MRLSKVQLEVLRILSRGGTVTQGPSGTWYWLPSWASGWVVLRVATLGALLDRSLIKIEMSAAYITDTGRRVYQAALNAGRGVTE